MPRPRTPDTIIKCKSCKNMFTRHITKSQKYNGGFCSLKCYWKFKVGEKSHRWLGIGKPRKGIFYYEITINGESMKYHRYLMEKKIGRKLKKDEVVHHINENKLDNRIENLQLMTKKEHLSHHWDSKFEGMKVRSIKEYKCTLCEKKFKRNASQVKKSKQLFCSKSCVNKAVRKRIIKKPFRGIIHPCNMCKKHIRVNMYRFKRFKRHFCSRKCMYSHGWKSYTATNASL